MKYYVIESHFEKPFETFGDIVPQHRAWLQAWYDKGVLLCSGPKSDKTGGMLVGRADDISAMSVRNCVPAPLSSPSRLVS